MEEKKWVNAGLRCPGDHHGEVVMCETDGEVLRCAGGDGEERCEYEVSLEPAQ